MRIFSKLFSAVRKLYEQGQIKVVMVSSSELTLDQWRKDTRLVTSAKELTRNEVFRMQVAVLENSHPRYTAFVVSKERAITSEERAAHQSKIEGYQLCLNNLEAMSKPFSLSKPLVAKFEPPTDK